MPTRRSVSDIKANLLRPSLTSHFEVEFAFPNKLINEKDSSGKTFLEYNGINTVNDTKLRLLCSEATLPGSNLATLELTNDFHGVTERHAYRRVYDDRIDFTFYVDADNYLPIHLFETWIKFIVDESRGAQSAKGGVGSADPNYFYRVRYPEEYMVKTGTKVIKFERDYLTTLEYEFINVFPISISSMPISYDSSSLLKCTVSMSYIRYILNKGSISPINDPQQKSLTQQASENSKATPGFGVPSLNDAYNRMSQSRPSVIDSFAKTNVSGGGFGLTGNIGGFSQSAAKASGNTLVQQVVQQGLAEAATSRAGRSFTERPPRTQPPFN